VWNYGEREAGIELCSLIVCQHYCKRKDIILQIIGSTSFVFKNGHAIGFLELPLTDFLRLCYDLPL